jgi:hypothetical protein
MPFDKGKFISDFADSGMAEAQAELLAESQADMFNHMLSRQDLEGLRREMGERIDDSNISIRREMREESRKTRLVVDDVHGEVRRSEARLEGSLKAGFAGVNHRFNVLALSNTTVILAVIACMAYLFRS